jgi:hypothetical protein
VGAGVPKVSQDEYVFSILNQKLIFNTLQDVTSNKESVNSIFFVMESLSIMNVILDHLPKSQFPEIE